MKLSELRAALVETGVTPSKGLGQNFLHDQNVARWIVGQLELRPGDPLVEIGPGLGALTEFAVPGAGSALLIEKDGRLADFLRARFTSPQVTVMHADACGFDVRTLFPLGPVKVLGNLPYYVTSPVIFAFATEPSPASRMVFTIQREVAERLAAEPGNRDYGAPTVLLGRRWRTRILRHLPPSVFTPQPKVGSSVIEMVPRPPGELPDCDGARFSALVKRGFSQRRKQLGKLLGLSEWPDLARAAGIAETARAEELSVADWIALANASDPAPAKPAQDVHGERFPVVDGADRVVGEASRAEVHAKGLNHRAVHVFVFNAEGELFLQKRSRHKDRHPGVWDSSASGHVEVGQTYEHAAAREIGEELGVSAPVEFVAKLPPSKANGCEFVALYRAQHEGPFRLPPAEIECGAFFPVSTVHAWAAARPEDFAGGFLECLMKVR